MINVIRNIKKQRPIAQIQICGPASAPSIIRISPAHIPYKANTEATKVTINQMAEIINRKIPPKILVFSFGSSFPTNLLSTAEDAVHTNKLLQILIIR
jgi:hypothetical protein